VERVVNGTYNMQKRWIEQHELGWDARKAQASAQVGPICVSVPRLPLPLLIVQLSARYLYSFGVCMCYRPSR
jgi:hypothetical protein